MRWTRGSKEKEQGANAISADLRVWEDTLKSLLLDLAARARQRLTSLLRGTNAAALLTGCALACASTSANDFVPDYDQAAGYLGDSKLAIIMDDMGYSMARGQRVLDLPGAMTIAILPFTPSAAELATATVAQGKEVIVHQPMEPQRPQGSITAKGMLTTGMPANDFYATLSAAIDSVPHSVGISNHTGSKLTSHGERMGWVMDHIRQRDLFFVDSRTSANTVAHRTAQEFDVPTVSRDVFLDHVITPAAIEKQFERAVRLAKLRGSAVLIAHPHEASLRFLEERLPRLIANAEVRLVTAGSLVTRREARPGELVLPQDPMSAHTAPGR